MGKMGCPLAIKHGNGKWLFRCFADRNVAVFPTRRLTVPKGNITMENHHFSWVNPL